MIHTIAIIGAGPAGVAAAVQLQRAGQKPLLFEPGRVGGLLHSALWIENYPGFPDGIGGAGLALMLSRHLEKLEIPVLTERVVSVSFGGDVFHIRTGSREVDVRYLIVASGTGPKPIPFPVTEQLSSRVHSEITPLLSIEGQKIAIVGGGDAAFDYALNLSRKNEVAIICRSKPSCLGLLRERVAVKGNIIVEEGVVIENVWKAKDGLSLSLRGVKQRSNLSPGCHCERPKGSVAIPWVSRGPSLCARDDLSGHFGRLSSLAMTAWCINVDHLLFAIGRDPCDDFLHAGMTDEQIESLAKEDRLIFAGDIKNGKMRQAVIAAGDGLRAAMLIANSLPFARGGWVSIPSPL